MSVIDHRPGRQPPPSQTTPGAARPRRDPAPSRFKYRLERMWLTPLYRRVVRVGVPAFVAAMVVGIWLSDPDRRVALTDGVDTLIDKIQSRDEFMVTTMQVEGASPVVDKALRAMLPVELPASSFDIDLTALRLQVMQLDAVESIDLRIKPGGVLSAVVVERKPALLWRHARGIEILDAGGHRVASVTGREVRPDLALIAGEGADLVADQALALIDAAGPILPRLRGLVWRGERRWDVVLDHGQRIQLPEQGAVTAMEAVIGLDRSQDLLGRDISVIDLRDPSRPVARLGIDAQNTIRAARGLALLGPDGQVIPADTKTGG